MGFRLWLETSLTPAEIDWWAKYTKNWTFKTEQEARDFLFRTLQHFDKQHGGAFGVKGPEHNKSVADSIPLYQSGKSFKIGKRVRAKSWSWEDTTIRPNSIAELTTAGYVNMFDSPRLSAIQFVPISKIRKNESHSDLDGGIEKVNWLVSQIKNNIDSYFKAIVISDSGGIIDGHHRFEAAKLMKMRQIPVQIVTYKNSD